MTRSEVNSGVSGPPFNLQAGEGAGVFLKYIISTLHEINNIFQLFYINM